MKACWVLLNVSWIRHPHVIRPFRHRCHRLHCRLGYVCPNFIFRLQTIRCSVLLSSGPYRLPQPFLEYLARMCTCCRHSMAAYHFLCLKIAAVWLNLLTDHVDVVSFDLSRHIWKLGKERFFHIHVSCGMDVRVWNTRRTLDSDIGWVVPHKKTINILYAYILLAYSTIMRTLRPYCSWTTRA